jgi:hypothetical protein
MRDDFDAIPEADDRRHGAGSMLARIYLDIGLAAVAEALNLMRTEFEPDLSRSIERGEFYLLPDRSRARAEMVAWSSPSHPPASVNDQISIRRTRHADRNRPSLGARRLLPCDVSESAAGAT